MSQINNPQHVYFKASDDPHNKTGKFCLGAQDLTYTGIKNDSKLLSSFNDTSSNYSYYKDTLTIESDGKITPQYDNQHETLTGEYETPSYIGDGGVCPNISSTNNIYKTSDAPCDGPEDNRFPGCARSTNTCDYSEAPEKIWTCDWSKGCMQISNTDLEDKQTRFKNRINFPRAQGMYPHSDHGSPQLHTYDSENKCKQQCAGPYSRCNTNIENEKAPGYPSWKLDDPITYQNEYTATTQNWFYCDKNIHCHAYTDTDPCFCSLPKTIPRAIADNPNFTSKYGWQVLDDFNHQNGGAFDYLGTATPYQYYTNNDNNVQPTNGKVKYSDDIVYESQNWFKLLENTTAVPETEPTADRPWLFTKSHNYWPELCDYTDKEIKYQCHDRQDQLMSTGFCGSPGLKPTDEHTQDNHRIGMMTGYGPVNFYSNECTKNDLSAVQLPNYTNFLQILGNDGYYRKNGYPSRDPANMWGSIPTNYVHDEGGPGKYANKRLELGSWFGQGAITFQGWHWDNVPLENNNLDTAIAPFNCVRTPAAHPVYDVGKTSEVSGT